MPRAFLVLKSDRLPVESKSSAVPSVSSDYLLQSSAFSASGLSPMTSPPSSSLLSRGQHQRRMDRGTAAAEPVPVPGRPGSNTWAGCDVTSTVLAYPNIAVDDVIASDAVESMSMPLIRRHHLHLSRMTSPEFRPSLMMSSPRPSTPTSTRRTVICGAPSQTRAFVLPSAERRNLADTSTPVARHHQRRSDEAVEQRAGSPIAGHVTTTQRRTAFGVDEEAEIDVIGCHGDDHQRSSSRRSSSSPISDVSASGMMTSFLYV